MITIGVHSVVGCVSVRAVKTRAKVRMRISIVVFIVCLLCVPTILGMPTEGIETPLFIWVIVTGASLGNIVAIKLTK